MELFRAIVFAVFIALAVNVGREIVDLRALSKKNKNE